MKRSGDNLDASRQRVSRQAREEGEKPVSLSIENSRLFGNGQQKSSGSLHTDTRRGVVVGLAARGVVAVYPAAGRWENRPKMDQSDRGVNYSLVISIEVFEIEANLWTLVYQWVAIVTEV